MKRQKTFQGENGRRPVYGGVMHPRSMGLLRRFIIVGSAPSHTCCACVAGQRERHGGVREDHDRTGCGGTR